MLNRNNTFLKNRMSFKSQIRAVRDTVRRVTGFVHWLLNRATDISTAACIGKQRLLIVYDLSSQPFSIGDVLVFQEAALVLREMYAALYIDFAFVYDPEKPTNGSQAFNSITKNNVTYSLPALFSAAQINQHLGSFHVFNSHTQVYRFIADNAYEYHVWPPAWEQATHTYMYYSIFNDLLYTYFNKHQHIPNLSSRPLLMNWAIRFMTKNIYPQIPITVQIRNNKLFGTHRNSDLETWLSFFRYCENRYPVKFIIICALDEIDARMRNCSNVLIAKDFNTNIEQELALIEAAEIHMGASSGMSTMAIFNKKPYLIVNCDAEADLYQGMAKDGTFLRMQFSTPIQQFSTEKETLDLLIHEFSRMWSTIDIEYWRESIRHHGDAGDDLYSWLR